MIAEFHILPDISKSSNLHKVHGDMSAYEQDTSLRILVGDSLSEIPPR